MRGQQRIWSARRAAIASAVIVAAIAGAVGVTIGLYQAALSQATDVYAADADSRYAQELTSIFAEQRIAMFRYIASGAPASLSSVAALNAQFRQVASVVTPETPTRAQALAAAVAAQAHYYSEFQADRVFVTASPSRKFSVIGQLDLNESPVTAPLAALVNLETQRAGSSSSAAGSSSDQARVIGVGAAVLAVLAGAGFGLFVVRVLRRAHRRETELTGALGRLSDRDELLARLRSAATVLGEVAGELRVAATNAAAVTSEQSAAVAQTSATIQELAATADRSPTRYARYRRRPSGPAAPCETYRRR
jgi:hypothetical protein